MTKTVETGLLEVAYEEWGDATGSPVVLLHGFPDDATTFASATRPLANAGFRCLAPYLRGFGPTRFLDPATSRSGQVAALARDAIDFADALGLREFTLVGHDFGARAAYAVAVAVPERLRALISLSVPYGPAVSKESPSSAQARAFWYQWYFHTPQGVSALASDRGEFCRNLWRAWSPGWSFTDEEFDATARSFDNPDFVDVVIHFYRRRWRNTEGDGRYASLESILQGPPKIQVPTLLLAGDEDGANLLETSKGLDHLFDSGYEMRTLEGVGHFIQRERPEAVVQAVLDVAKP